jgi:hypothetical protein
MASLVLPTPGGPVRVTSRTSLLCRVCRTCSMRVLRPITPVRGEGRISVLPSRARDPPPLRANRMKESHCSGGMDRHSARRSAIWRDGVRLPFSIFWIAVREQLTRSASFSCVRSRAFRRCCSQVPKVTISLIAFSFSACMRNRKKPPGSYELRITSSNEAIVRVFVLESVRHIIAPLHCKVNVTSSCQVTSDQ